MSLSNLKIHKKIALVLGGIILITVALSTLSLWTSFTAERLAADSLSRMTKSKLAATVAAENAAIGQDVATMVASQNTSEDLLRERKEHRGKRQEALAEFRKLANTPKSIQHGADMEELVKSASAEGDRIESLVRNHHNAVAVRELPIYSAAHGKMRAKATEAMAWQEQLLGENEKKRAESETTILIALIAGCLVAVVTSAFGGLVLARGVARPLGTAVAHIERIAEGDLSQDAPVEFLARGDEIGNLARAKQRMIDALRTFTREIAGGAQVLASSSTELLASSTQLTAGSRNASDKANSVSAAAEEMSSNITSVAAGMEQTTTNLAHVAAATGEMTATIGEIAQNSEKARRITDEATRQAARINDQIHQLGAAAREIGKVTETITDISSQTNLLALNATIEAARAGAAGKGFAVVATEIKALAEQTAAATEDIKGRISGVQSATSGGIAEIEKVSLVIQEVNSIVASIAAAIEEQSAATKDIARNIAEASTGVNEANTRVAESSHVSREIAKDIASVNGSANEMAGGGESVRDSAGELSRVAESLQATVAHFRLA